MRCCCTFGCGLFPHADTLALHTVPRWLRPRILGWLHFWLDFPHTYTVVPGYTLPVYRTHTHAGLVTVYPSWLLVGFWITHSYGRYVTVVWTCGTVGPHLPTPFVFGLICSSPHARRVPHAHTTLVAPCTRPRLRTIFIGSAWLPCTFVGYTVRLHGLIIHIYAVVTPRTRCVADAHGAILRLLRILHARVYPVQFRYYIRPALLRC